MVATLKSIDYSILQQCMHCGMCLPTCPTYDATKRERHSPRGRIALMRAIADDELAITSDFADEMSYCLGCLACQTACPAGVNYATLFETARADIERSGVASHDARTFWRALTLGTLFKHPELLRWAGRLLRFHQRSGLEALVRRSGLLRLLPHTLRRLEPQAPPIASRFSNQLIRPVEAGRAGTDTVEPTAPHTNRRSLKVAVLIGCVQDLVYPDVNRDTVDVLLANGCEVHTPPTQPCCGSLHAHNGELEMAQSQARRLIALLPPDRYDAIISNAGGCGSHLRHYGPLLDDDPNFRDRAHAWDRKLKDVHEFLDQIGCRAPQAAPFDDPVTITYHESCHLAHGQKITREPRALLRLLPTVTLKELPESTWCCGAAGVYTITQPDQAEKLLQRKCDHIAGTGASCVATGNPGCQLQITRGLTARGVAVDVTHPVSLLAKAYRRESSETARPRG